jgi:hypothetical protein
MKYVIEFGVMGGEHVDNLVITSLSTASKLASSLVRVFENTKDLISCNQNEWKLSKNCPRMSWTSPTHFVSLSKLDGVSRGPTSSKLWKLNSGE